MKFYDRLRYSRIREQVKSNAMIENWKASAEEDDIHEPVILPWEWTLWKLKYCLVSRAEPSRVLSSVEGQRIIGAHIVGSKLLILLSNLTTMDLHRKLLRCIFSEDADVGEEEPGPFFQVCGQDIIHVLAFCHMLRPSSCSLRSANGHRKEFSLQRCAPQAWPVLSNPSGQGTCSLRQGEGFYAYVGNVGKFERWKVDIRRFKRELYVLSNRKALMYLLMTLIQCC